MPMLMRDPGRVSSTRISAAFLARDGPKLKKFFYKDRLLIMILSGIAHIIVIIAGRPQVFAGILAPLLRATSILLVSLPEWSGAGLASPLASLPVQAGIAVGILPIVLLASSPLFRWSEALFSRKRP